MYCNGGIRVLFVSLLCIIRRLYNALISEVHFMADEVIKVRNNKDHALSYFHQQLPVDLSFNGGPYPLNHTSDGQPTIWLGEKENAWVRTVITEYNGLLQNVVVFSHDTVLVCDNIKPHKLSSMKNLEIVRGATKALEKWLV
jgi:hypothetical protein